MSTFRFKERQRGAECGCVGKTAVRGEGGELFRAVFAPPLRPRKNGKALTGIALPPSDVLMYASDASKTPQGPSETPPGLLQVA